jgi:hypothetical protein
VRRWKAREKFAYSLPKLLAMLVSEFIENTVFVCNCLIPLPDTALKNNFVPRTAIALPTVGGYYVGNFERCTVKLNGHSSGIEFAIVSPYWWPFSGLKQM